ncbi:phosphodiester glycosidase family protein [Streptomyces sp. DSM 116496]|uniref:phosphodiester glycosidase family protein n=1 Tax=Streptomyces stoeckheimensis TaxID=3344656 RepID=UPI0038B2F060
MARRTRFAAALAVALAVTLAGCTADPRPPDEPVPSGSQPEDLKLPEGVTYKESVRKLDGQESSHVRVLTIRPDAKVRVAGMHGPAVAHAETVRKMAESFGALAAVNASFFDISTGKSYAGYDGDPLGLYTEGGKVLSEAIKGRPTLLLGYNRGKLSARVDEVSTDGVVVSDDGVPQELDGINRVPGRVLGCGGVGGDLLAVTEEPMQEPYGGLCTDTDELVAFTPEWGERTPPGPPGSMEVLLDADGRVTSVRKPAGGAVPKNGSTLYGIGTGTEWLRTNAQPGAALTTSFVMNDATGAVVPGPVETAVGGRYRLLRDGVPDIGEPTSPTKTAPRTAVGVTKNGSLLLVTIDGRAPGVDAGATVMQTAKLMASLGARDALMFDGGGSTTMIVRDELRNTPRGAEGAEPSERPVANGIGIFEQ